MEKDWKFLGLRDLDAPDIKILHEQFTKGTFRGTAR